VSAWLPNHKTTARCQSAEKPNKKKKQTNKQTKKNQQKNKQKKTTLLEK
jgi:hypothetical protein